MSSKSISNRPSAPRVATGMPWWIWASVILFALVLLVSIVRNLIPEDPDQLFAEAEAALQQQQPAVVQDRIERLRPFDAFSGKVAYLEGAIFLGRNMPLKAIPLLLQASESNDIRGKALVYLGQSYGRSGQLPEAIEVLKSALDDPESGDRSRSILAGMLSSVQAYDEAIEHLNVLIERNVDPAQILALRAEIYLDTHRFKEAAADLEASISANEADPAIGSKAVKMLRARTMINDFSSTGGVEDKLDNPVSQNHFKSLRYLSEGKLEDAQRALEQAIMEGADTPMLSGVFGKITAAHDNPQLALDGLPRVYTACLTSPRNADLMRTLQTLATQAGENELAARCAENVDGLEAIRRQMFAQLEVVAPNYDDVEGRLILADLALDCGETEFADRIFQGLVLFFTDYESVIQERRASFEARRLPLVPIPAPPGFNVSVDSLTNEEPPPIPPRSPK